MDHATDDGVLGAVGPRLRTLRRARGITLADLTATTGVPESTLSRLESGLVGAPRTGDPRMHSLPVSRFGIADAPCCSPGSWRWRVSRTRTEPRYVVCPASAGSTATAGTSAGLRPAKRQPRQSGWPRRAVVSRTRQCC